MDTREDPVDVVLEDDVDWMETAEGILKQWSLEKEIPSLQGRLAESTRLVEGWNLEHIDPLSTLKVNVLIWSMRAFMDEVFGANWVSRIPSQVRFVIVCCFICFRCWRIWGNYVCSIV